jgi:hypothetical protein
LLWQVFTWVRGQRTKVSVTASFSNVIDVNGSTKGVKFEAVNHSGHAVEIKNAWVRGDGPEGSIADRETRGIGELPFTLPPRASYEWSLSLHRIKRADIEVSRGVEGWVYLATGENFHSQRLFLRARSRRVRPGGGGPGPDDGPPHL